MTKDQFLNTLNKRLADLESELDGTEWFELRLWWKDDMKMEEAFEWNGANFVPVNDD
jgi:hypothetical protein